MEYVYGRMQSERHSFPLISPKSLGRVRGVRGQQLGAKDNSVLNINSSAGLRSSDPSARSQRTVYAILRKRLMRRFTRRIKSGLFNMRSAREKNSAKHG